MKSFLLFFYSLFFVLNCYSQVDFSERVKKMNPQKNENILLKKKYYLINKNDRVLNSDFVDVIKKVDENFIIVTKKSGEFNSSFKGELFEINNLWKFSSRYSSIQKKKNDILNIVVQTSNLDNFLIRVNEKDLKLKQLYTYKDIIVLEATTKVVEKLADIYECRFIDLKRLPTEESIPIEKIDLSINNVYKAHNNFQEIDGKNSIISIKELMFDVDDVDLRKRTKLFGNQSEEISSHATTMATVIGGGGNNSFDSKGVAYQSMLTSSDFTTVLPDEDSLYKNNTIFIQNHSYGTEIESFYGAEAKAFDQSVVDTPELLHVFSSGNSGELTSQNGTYKDVLGYANMTGNFKMAKNVLVVGGIDKELNVASRSSKGPTFDGRVKPELVAHGPDGTSDAAAIVSGTAALLQQKYKEKEGAFPSSSLLKSVLIAGADDVGIKGVDFKSGYGNVNAYQSVSIIDNNYFINDIISNGEIKEYAIPINLSEKELKIALVWNDVPANVDDNKTLVNDLGLELSKDTTTWLPWVLDASPSVSILEKQAVRGRDHLNNVELITVENPELGTYTLKVKTEMLTTTTQSFSIAYYFKPKDTFVWNYPTKNDRLPSSADKYLRWNNNFDTPIDKVEYSMNGLAWTEIPNSINTTTPYLLWNIPEVNGVAQLRALVNGVYYVSEEFIISDILIPTVDFNCEESIQFSWNAIPNASGYTIDLLSDKFMHAYSTTGNTFINIPKNSFETPYISVTPFFLNKGGVKGKTINYNLQGVFCYYKSFLAFLKDDNVVDIRLNLSTLTNVASVVFEKVTNDGVKIVKSFIQPTSLEFIVEDNNITGGESKYKARIILDDNSEIETDVVTINYPFNNTLDIYPNPVSASNGMFVYSKGDNLDLQIIDLTGRLLFSSKIDKIRKNIQIEGFKTGLFFARLLRNGKQIAVKKILIKT